VTFAKEAWPFVLPFVVVRIALLAFGHPRSGAAALVLAVLILLFFRNPHRHFVGDAGAVLAPADGKVLVVDELEDPAVGPGRYLRVVTFLSVFDVHVQRSPAAGEVVVSRLARGRKVAAFRPDAGTVNEQHLTVLETPAGRRIGVRQIAGLVARRVVSYLEVGQNVERGQMLGVIKFGSRVDLLVPAEGYRVRVRVGDRVANGATVMAEALPTPTAGVPDEEPEP